MLQLWSCDAFTGEKLGVLPVSDMSWERLLSARGNGRATIPLDGSHSRADLNDLLLPWRRILALDRDGRVEYGGYVLGGDYSQAKYTRQVVLRDIWRMFNRRGGWDRNHPYTAAWSTTVTGVRGEHGWQAINRGRNTGVLNRTRFPVTRAEVGGGEVVTHKVKGHLLEYISDILTNLMDEGLDVYMQPRWLNGSFDWAYRAGMKWQSGHEFDLTVTTQDPDVIEFTEDIDADRVATNAGRLGEGSEVDMLARSRFNDDSPFPVLDLMTPSKTVSDALQLDSMALADLDLYGSPTVQRNFQVRASEGIDVGDTTWLHFDGDPVISDGWQRCRVVKVNGDLGEFVKIGVQPTGGA